MKRVKPAAIAFVSICLVTMFVPVAAAGGPPRVTANSFNGSYAGAGMSSVTTDCPATAASKALHSTKSTPVTHAAVAHGTFFGQPIVVAGSRGSVRFSRALNFMHVTFSASLALGAGGVSTLTFSESGSGTTNGCTVRLQVQFTGRRA